MDKTATYNDKDLTTDAPAPNTTIVENLQINLELTKKTTTASEDEGECVSIISISESDISSRPFPGEKSPSASVFESWFDSERDIDRYMPESPEDPAHTTVIETGLDSCNGIFLSPYVKKLPRSGAKSEKIDALTLTHTLTHSPQQQQHSHPDKISLKKPNMPERNSISPQITVLSNTKSGKSSDACALSSDSKSINIRQQAVEKYSPPLLILNGRERTACAHTSKQKQPQPLTQTQTQSPPIVSARAQKSCAPNTNTNTSSNAYTNTNANANTNTSTMTKDKDNDIQQQQQQELQTNRQQQQQQLTTANISAISSRKCLFPQTAQADEVVSDLIDTNAFPPLPKPHTKNNLVSDWLSRVPPLKPNEMTPLTTPIKNYESNILDKTYSSPYKRTRTALDTDSDDEDGNDYMNDSTMRAILATPVRTPAFKSNFAVKLHQEARRVKLNDDVDDSNAIPLPINTKSNINNNKNDISAQQKPSQQQQAKKQTPQQQQAQQQQQQVHLQQQQQQKHLEQHRQQQQVQQQQQKQEQDQPKLKQQQQQQHQKQQQQQHQQQQLPLRAVTKVPALFLPLVPAIMPILDKLTSNPSIGKLTTKTTAKNGLRVQCKDMHTHDAILSALAEDSIELHTHQARINKGFRIIIRYLHHTTPCPWISDQLKSLGYDARFIRVMRHRFNGKPLNLFEIELNPTPDGSHTSILDTKTLGSQSVVVERQSKPRDPPQCHRCSKVWAHKE